MTTLSGTFTKQKFWKYHSFYDTAPRSYNPLVKTISMKEAGKLLSSVINLECN